MIQKDTPCNQQKNADADPDHKPTENPELTQRQLSAIQFLLQGLSDAAVAQKIGVDRTTVYRWRTVHTPFRWELTPDPVTSPRRNRSEVDDIIEATRCTHGIPEHVAEDHGDEDD